MRVGLAQVVHVVGAHERQAEILRDRRNAAVDDALLLDAVPLHLEEEVLGAEDVPVRGRRVARLLFLLVRRALGDLALQAAAQADQALRVLREQFLVDARLVVEAFGVPGRHELDEIVVALVASRRAARDGSRSRPDCRSSCADRPARRRPRSRESASRPRARVVVEDHRREQVAVLGDGDRRHLQLAAWSSNSSMRHAPSSSENSVCRCRWTNSAIIPTRSSTAASS